MTSRPAMRQIELVSSLAKRDLKARYKDSVLGFFWSLFRPAFLSLILWAVFSFIMPIRFEGHGAPYWLHVVVSVLAWTFLVGSLADASVSVIANGNLVKKVRLDAEVFPVASIVSNAVHLALALALVLGIVVVGGFGLRPALLLLPAAIAAEALLILGIAFFVASLNVFYRDVGSLLELGTMAWFYITPVIYPADLARAQLLPRFGEAGFVLYMLNPAAPVMVAVRRCLIYPAGTEMPDAQLAAWLAVSVLTSGALCAAGWWVFHRLSWRFADEL